MVHMPTPTLGVSRQVPIGSTLPEQETMVQDKWG